MCGIFGIISFKDEIKKSEDFLKYALKDLSRRGPDQSGIWRNKNITLGFQRLAIRDLSEAGHQPMVSPTGNLVIVFNGEIYNTQELIKWCNIDNNKLQGHSDTEILLLCFEKKGITDTLEKLDGIFAIALYNVEKKSLTLARDHAGIKPLYFGYCEDGIVFSSHYHLVTAHEYFCKKKLQKPSLYNYFRYGFIQEGEGLLSETYNLPHGHWISLSSASGVHWNPYINLGEFLKNEHITLSTNELHAAYKNVVNSQLVSDVPVGTFLSGGVDSTVTSALVKESKDDIVAFTIGVEDPELDETMEAKRFATYFHLNHLVKEIKEKEISGLMEDYDESMAEPLADFSSLLTLKVCELAKEQFSVALSGDGGDELFWGYRRFKEAFQYVSFFNASKIEKIFTIIKARMKGTAIPVKLLQYRNFKDYYLTKQGIPGSEYWTKKLMLSTGEKSIPYFAKLIDGEVSDEAEAMLYARALEYHIHMQRVLLKVDRASMYHSLEVRTPLLSRLIVNISKGYRYEDCVYDEKAKWPLRKLLKSMLPPGGHGSGPKKGFSPPMDKWLRGDLKDRFEKRLFLIPPLLADAIDPRTIKKMWSEHQSGNQDWSWMIWSIYSLFTWVDKKMFRTRA